MQLTMRVIPTKLHSMKNPPKAYKLIFLVSWQMQQKMKVYVGGIFSHSLFS